MQRLAESFLEQMNLQIGDRLYMTFSLSSMHTAASCTLLLAQQSLNSMPAV